MNETRAAELGFRIERIVSTTYVHNLPIDHTSVLAVVCTLVDIIYIVASVLRALLAALWAMVTRPSERAQPEKDVSTRLWRASAIVTKSSSRVLKLDRALREYRLYGCRTPWLC